MFENGGPQACYVHIPFCLSKCRYCDFVSFVSNAEERAAYTDALCREIAFTARQEGGVDGSRELRSIYFGGGTPGLLELPLMERILSCIYANFRVSDGVQLCLESNPGVSDYAKFKSLRTLGFNRLSLGIQSLRDRHLRYLGRAHDAQAALQAVAAAQRAGFSDISADLMLALPGQLLPELAEDMAVVLDLGLTHLSLYSLIIEEGTEFYRLYHEQDVSGETDSLPAGVPPLPDVELERAMYHYCIGSAAAAGLHRYEISNCALPGYESRQSLCYWQAEEYWGFGAAASAYVHGRRCSNTSDLSAYINLWGRSGAAGTGTESWPTDPDSRARYSECISITAAEAAQEYFMLGLRMLKGVSLAEFALRHPHISPAPFRQKLEDLRRRGLLSKAGERYFLSERGLDFANEVFAAFI